MAPRSTAFDRQVTSVLEAIGEAIVESITDEMLTVQFGFKYDLGEDSPLVNSVSYKIDPASRTVTIEAFDYYKYVESGRRPFTQWPPLPVLAEWIRRKNIQPRPGQTFNSLVWAIRKHIYQTALPPRPFISKAAATSERATSKIIQRFDFSVFFVPTKK